MLAEIDESLNLDPISASEVVGPRTKAVMPVHMFGGAADMDAFRTLCADEGLHLFEDRRTGQPFEGVEDGLGPGAHFVALAAGQVAEVLAADRIERPKHHHLRVLALLEGRLEARAQRERDRRRDGKSAQKMWLFPQKIPPLRVQYQYAGFRAK